MDPNAPGEVFVAANPVESLPPPQEQVHVPQAPGRAAEASNAAAARRTLFSLAFGLALIVLGTKFVLLPFPVTNLAELVRWALRLAIVAAPDVCFVAALTAICALAARPAARWPALCRPWSVSMFSLYCLAGVYAVASVPMYRVTMTPLTVRLLSFAGGPVVMGSSIRECLSAANVAALLLAPAALLLAPLIMRRCPWFRTGAPFPLAAWCLAMPLAGLYGAVCQGYVETHWTDPNRWERRIAQSPHAVFLKSCVTELCGDASPAAGFAAADESDFQLRPTVPSAGGADPASPLVAATQGDRPRNVVLIVLESTSAEYLSVYGARYAATPRLADLVQRHGVAFDNVYVQAPSSCNSLISLTASVYPRPDWTLMVRDSPAFEIPTIMQVLAPRGYRSCFLHSGYWSWKNRDRYLTDRGAGTLLDASNLPAEKVNSWGVSDRAMFRAALEWIDAQRGAPFFLLAYTIETHHPYVAAEPLVDYGASDPDFNRYLNALHAADENIGWFAAELAARGLEDSTLVAVTADHGESFGQHGQRVHSFGVYEPNVHVPLILLHPSLADLPRHARAIGQHIDIAPTLLDALAVPPPADWQGRSLLRGAGDARAYFFSVANEVVLGLRDGDFKYHYYVDGGQEELFDLAHDPAELVNLAAQERDRCAACRSRVAGLVSYQRKFLSRHGAP